MKNRNLNVMLSIAGSDNSGGAGIQCDIKTCNLLNAYCLSCVTVITSQNSKNVKEIFEIPPKILESQISSLLNDYKIDCIKVGLIKNITQTRSIIKFLKKFKKNFPIVVDPIYKSTTNKTFNRPKDYRNIYSLISSVKPIFTPNLYEAKILLNINDKCKIDPLEIVKKFYNKFKSPVVVTDAGSNMKLCEDFYCDTHNVVNKLTSKKILSNNTHGSGCTFSSSLVIFMAKGLSLSESVKSAKKFTKKCIINAPNFNLSYGPIGHFYERT